MKAKTTPMAITACTPHLFNTTGRACLGTREVISKLLLVGGGLCTLTEKKKHAICLHMKWKVLLHQHLRGKSKGQSHTAQLRCIFASLQLGCSQRNRFILTKLKVKTLNGMFFFSFSKVWKSQTVLVFTNC